MTISLATLSDRQMEIISAFNEYVQQRMSLRKQPAAANMPRYGHALTLDGGVKVLQRHRQAVTELVRDMAAADVAQASRVMEELLRPDQETEKEILAEIAGDATQVATMFEGIRKASAELRAKGPESPELLPRSLDVKLIWG